MPVTEEDLEAWARWVGMRFDPPMRDIAETIASLLIQEGGERPQFLRPETPMRDVIAWLQESKRSGIASLDWVELLMMFEEETRCDMTDVFAENIERATFGEYVEHLHAHRRSR